MATPISALQRNAAAVVRKVKASGKSEEITDRGDVVAILSPPPKLSGLDKLRAEGHVREGNMAEFKRLLKDLTDNPISFKGSLLEDLLEDRRSQRY